MNDKKQAWYSSPTLWMALVTIALLIFGGIVQMAIVLIPHWLSLVLGGLVALSIGFQKAKNAQDPNALMLADAPAHVLTTVGGVLVLVYAYLASQKIQFPIEAFASIEGVIVTFVGADRIKNAVILSNLPVPVNAPANAPVKPNG
jgi:hypothetical protein